MYFYDKYLLLYVFVIWFYILFISGLGFVYNWIIFRWLIFIGFLIWLKENNIYLKNRFFILWLRFVVVCFDISSIDIWFIFMIFFGLLNKLG